MTKIDIFSGFLGAGKTTLIKKLIAEAYKGEKLVLIENEFGEIGVDGAFLADAGIEVTEMNSGCICCSLVGDFSKALKKVLDTYTPDRILIEPSGVGKLSDVAKAVENVGEGLTVSSLVTVVDAAKCRMHLKNFGEFFGDQIAHASTVIFSHTKGLSPEKLESALLAVRTLNPTATVVTTDWEVLTGAQLLTAMERRNTLAEELKHLHEEESCPVCGHHHHEHHHHEHDEECHCHEHEHHHAHHHHDHGEECHCHEHGHHHEHHHDHGEECHCHEHGHHHHADEVFVSFGAETAKPFEKAALEMALTALSDEAAFGTVLRAKGIVAGTHGKWLHFDYIPGEPDVREGAAAVTGRLCVIGAGLQQEALSHLFGVELH